MVTDHERLEGLLGQHFDSKPIQDLLREIQPATVTVVEDETFLEVKRHGLCLLFGASKTLDAIFYYGDGRDGYRVFLGSLPEGLRLGLSRESVRSMLGPPERSGGGDDVPFLGVAPAFDRYRRGRLSLHIEYAPDDSRIALVTVMTVAATPG